VQRTGGGVSEEKWYRLWVVIRALRTVRNYMVPAIWILQVHSSLYSGVGLSVLYGEAALINAHPSFFDSRV